MRSKTRGRFLQIERLEIRELLSITNNLAVGQYAEPFDFVQPVVPATQDSGVSTSLAADAGGATLPADQSASNALLPAQPAASALSTSNPLVVVDPADGLRLVEQATVHGEWNTAGNFESWTVANAASSSVAGGSLTVTSQSGTSNPVQINLQSIASGPYLDYGYFDYLQIRLQVPINFNKDITFSFGTSTHTGFLSRIARSPFPPLKWLRTAIFIPIGLTWDW